MNVPLYAAALISFAILYLQFSFFLVWTLLITLAAMTVILAAQALRLGSATRKAASPSGPPEAARARLAEAKRLALPDQVITAIFIGVTWGIFSQLPQKPAPWIGPALTYGPGATVGVSSTELAVAVAVLLGVAVLMVAFWYQYALRSAAYRAAHYRTILLDPIASPARLTAEAEPTGECQFSDAYLFVMGPNPPAPSDLPHVHSGELRRVSLKGIDQALPREFVLCATHRNTFVRLELYYSPTRVAGR